MRWHAGGSAAAGGRLARGNPARGGLDYRLDRYHDAVEVLNRSIAAAKDATAFNTFFLAMCYHRLGDPEKARAEYDRAVAWMELFRPDDEELIGFRAEAESVLGR